MEDSQIKEVEADIARRLFSPKILAFTAFGIVVLVLSYMYILPEKPFFNKKAGRPVNVPLIFTALYSEGEAAEKGLVSAAGENDKTKISVELFEASSTAKTANLRKGADCSGEVKYELKDLSKGKSETILNVSFDDFKKEIPLSIFVGDGKSELSCGQFL